MINRSVPTSTLISHLTYRDPGAACDWLKRVFGFTEHFRYGHPVSGVQLYLGAACIMIAGPRQGTESPAVLGYGTQTLTLIVPDVDAHHAKARHEGASIVEDLNQTIYGERQYGAVDLEGHRWLFAQHVRDLSPEEWGATVTTPIPDIR